MAPADAAVRAEPVCTDRPIVGAARAGRDGQVLLGQAGGVFASGTDLHGSYHAGPIAGIRTTADGEWLSSDHGSVVTSGGTVRLNQPIVGA